MRAVGPPEKLVRRRRRRVQFGLWDVSEVVSMSRAFGPPILFRAVPWPMAKAGIDAGRWPSGEARSPPPSSSSIWPVGCVGGREHEPGLRPSNPLPCRTLADGQGWDRCRPLALQSEWLTNNARWPSKKIGLPTPSDGTPLRPQEFRLWHPGNWPVNTAGLYPAPSRLGVLPSAINA